MDPVQATIDIRKFVTGDVTYGLLAPEQAKQFYVQIYDQVEWSKLHRKETQDGQERRGRHHGSRRPAPAGQDRRPWTTATAWPRSSPAAPTAACA